jgi:hypothetical protein
LSTYSRVIILEFYREAASECHALPDRSRTDLNAMPPRNNRFGLVSRLVPIVGLTVAGTIAVIFGIVAPDLPGYLPTPVVRRPSEMALVVLAAAYAIARISRRRVQDDGQPADCLRRLLDWLDRRAAGSFGGGLSAVVIAVCLAFLATWVPHYLFWPWYRDSDTFATMAQSWDAGILPYRDIRAYNFPGAIYLFWVLGKVAGWGRTWSLYAVDAAALMLLGVTLSAWSRRCLGKRLPGVAAYLIFLTFYLSLDYQTVAERDWHASLCVVLGLLALEGWPGRASRVISALLAALALAVRPHVVVFLPALWAAVAERTDRAPTGAIESHHRLGLVRSLAEWSLACGLFTAMAFAPVLIAGIADDLARGLKVVAIGGPYNRANPEAVAQAFTDQLREPATLIVVGLLALILVWSRGEFRRRAATWGLALAGALIYRLFHPFQHFYLIYPVVLVGSVASAIPIAWIADRPRIAPALRVIALLALISELSAGIPRYCDISATIKAFHSLARGHGLPEWSPPGSWAWFDLAQARRYSWRDYRHVLIYLRETTGSATPVANVLRSPPFPAINGPVGRLSPFRAESGICWMWLVDVDLEPEFTVALERSTDSVVVWSPGERWPLSKLKLDRLTAIIREHYRLEARFGQIEVWRRATEPQ